MRRCAAAFAPARLRTAEDAWQASVGIGSRPPDGDGDTCWSTSSGSTISRLALGAAPAGVVDRIRAGLAGEGYAGVTLHIKATTAGFRAAYRRDFEGVVGHSSGVP